MLKTSIIEQRAREVSESRSYLQNRECKEQFNKANQAYESIKGIIPNTITEQFPKLFDNYISASDKMHIVIEREAYKQGLIDGIEIKKLLTSKSL